jgi:hypothetical protein
MQKELKESIDSLYKQERIIYSRAEYAEWHNVVKALINLHLYSMTKYCLTLDFGP